MILGVAHVCHGSRDKEADVARFAMHGYRVSFAESALPVHEAKVPFLRFPSALHDAVFLVSPGRLSIEVVHHEGEGRGATPYEYVPADSGIVRVACRNRAASETFWTDGLGFRGAGAPGVLEMVSPVPAWRARVRLDDAPGMPDSYLDDEGWTCLSLIVSDVDAVRRRLLPVVAGPVSEVYPLVLHGRKVSLCFLRGPSGEIVELFQIGR